MAAATYSITTGATNLVELGKKVQGPLMLGYMNGCKELTWHTPLKRFTLAASQREVTAPLDITRNGGGAAITEGGSEAKPQTAAPEDLTFTFLHWNYRYSFSRTTEILAGTQGEAAYLFDQMKYQARKMRESMCQRFSMGTYGYSTGIICLTSTNATTATQTLTLIDGYGESDLDTAAYLSQFFAVGDRVALVRSGALVTNAIGDITAVTPATPSIAVTFNGSVDADANDAIVFSNSLENTTLAGGTDYNKWPIGLLDVANTASIHGLSSASFPLWATYVNTSGGRFGFARYSQMRRRIENNGGGTPDTLIVSDGVKTDMTDLLQGAVRYAGPLSMQLDASTVVKGIGEPKSSRWVPNSRAWLLDSDSMKVWHPAGQMPDENGILPDSNNNLVITDKLENQSGKVVGYDYLFGRVFTNRGNVAMSSGLTEQ